MVKKLFKYEFIHYLKSLLPFGSILLVIALFSRIIQFFDNGSKAYNIIFISSVVMYVIGIILCLIMCFVTAITRYYKNLFTAEGYLTMTLPVTENQHIFTKLITAFSSVLITFVNILLSFCIITLGEPLVEVYKAAAYLMKWCYEHNATDTILITFELIIYVCLAVLYMLMLFYSCITIGQLAKKNRILAAFGVYFGYYVLTQILGTVFMILIVTTDLMEYISNLFSDITEIQVMEYAFGGASVFSIILTCIFYVVCQKIIRYRLNLE